MHTYLFKTYINGGREYYEYTDAADREQTIRKDFPFPESLMSLLYMDIWELEPITKRMDKALMSFISPGTTTNCNRSGRLEGTGAPAYLL